MQSVECHHCGAVIEKRSARFCDFCGTEVIRGDVTRKQTRDEQREMRFEMLRANPELPDLINSTPVLRHPQPPESTSRCR